MSVNEKMTAIADAIRDKTGNTKTLTLDEMVAEIPRVYDTGKQNEKKLIFDSLDGLYCMFYQNQNMDLLPHLLDADLTRVESTYNMFQNNTVITEFHAPTSLKPKNIRGMFYNCTNLITVSGLADPTDTETLHRNFSITDAFNGCTKLVSAGAIRLGGITSVPRAFQGCAALQQVEIVGVIGVTGLSFGDCVVLSKASIESVINALSTTTSNLTITFSKVAVNNAFGIDVDDESTYTAEWNALRGSKSNWNFSFV